MRNRFWAFVYNCVAHPLEGFAVLFLGYVPGWVDRFHHWACPTHWPGEPAHCPAADER